MYKDGFGFEDDDKLSEKDMHKVIETESEHDKLERKHTKIFITIMILLFALLIWAIYGELIRCKNAHKEIIDTIKIMCDTEVKYVSRQDLFRLKHKFIMTYGDNLDFIDIETDSKGSLESGRTNLIPLKYKEQSEEYLMNKLSDYVNGIVDIDINYRVQMIKLGDMPFDEYLKSQLFNQLNVKINIEKDVDLEQIRKAVEVLSQEYNESNMRFDVYEDSIYNEGEYIKSIIYNKQDGVKLKYFYSWKFYWYDLL